METVEILVPNHAKASVRRELGNLGATRIASEPSHRSARRLLVGWLPDLAGARGVRELVALRNRVSHEVPVVFLAHASGEAQPSVALAAVQNLIRWSRTTEEEPYVAPTLDALRRMILARRNGAEGQLIASASVENDHLVVWSCEPRRFEVPVSDLPELSKLPAEELEDLELSPSGSRIRWPSADIDINLDTIREHADPEVRRRHERQAREDAARYAKAIRKFREERGLKQTDIAGLTERQVRRLEEGDSIPRFDTLKKLAAAHGMNINEYLDELARRSRRKPRKRA